MRWSERLWRLRECWRKLGALAGRGVGKRLDYTCDLIMEAWVDDAGEKFYGDPEGHRRYLRETLDENEEVLP